MSDRCTLEEAMAVIEVVDALDRPHCQATRAGAQECVEAAAVAPRPTHDPGLT